MLIDWEWVRERELEREREGGGARGWERRAEREREYGEGLYPAYFLYEHIRIDMGDWSCLVRSLKSLGAAVLREFGMRFWRGDINKRFDEGEKIFL